MLADLLRRLSGRPENDTLLPADDQRIAVAALLVIAAHADHHYADIERVHIERALADRYGLDAAAAAALRAQGEAAEQASVDLYRFTSLVKAGVRQVHNPVRMDVIWAVIDGMIAHSSSREAMSQVVRMATDALRQGAQGRPANDADPRVALVVDGKVAANSLDMDDAALLARSDALATLPGQPFKGGARWVVDADQIQVSVPAGPATVDTRFIAMTTGEPQEFMVEPYYRLVNAAAGLFKRAA